ncbi:hypothetical protein B1R32_101280 [Abditibacterium utsteinense]|uniref:Actin-binding WH2 domain-containing protein n=1 Tax=Abditibacterium utsteinense TaxID=1960156 RepID=A0A2S8SXP7_9BACT|nr:hypothetical protein [Abditibacterium utsteinense]PQV65538.1 hypothetical protein B1R32_101280 [Abditibacterium utsteinense]
MEHALRDLDRLLRGDATRLAALKQGKIEVEEGQMPWIIIGLGLFYGLCMGCFALFNKPFADAWLQTAASMAKVPVLFGATLVVTFPSLYVFNTLVGSRLTLQSVWRLLLSALAVMMAVLASLGPIVGFFSISTTNYPFILLLNVAVFSLSGFLGLKFLLHTLHRLMMVLYEAKAPAPIVPTVDEFGFPIAGAKEIGALEAVDERAMGANVRQVFAAWVLVFGMVGAQMSWVLRPFISSPDRPFIFFSPRESNFFAAVFEAIVRVFAG